MTHLRKPGEYKIRPYKHNDLQALSLPPRQSSEIIDRVAEAVSDAAKLMPPCIRENTDFKEVGSRMLSIRQSGADAIAKKQHLSCQREAR